MEFQLCIVKSRSQSTFSFYDLFEFCGTWFAYSCWTCLWKHNEVGYCKL